MSKTGAPRRLHKASKNRRYTLLFDEPGHDHEGLEVVMGPPTVGDLTSMMELADTAQAGGATEQAKEALSEFFGMFARHLIDWNAGTDDDEPVPCDLDGVKSRPLDEIMAVFEAWFEGVTGVSPPLRRPSEDGDPLAQIPMTPLPGSGG